MRLCMSSAEKVLERDTFKSAQEALQYGLIDEVIEKRPVIPDDS